jgi:hypothetical protein
MPFVRHFHYHIMEKYGARSDRKCGAQFNDGSHYLAHGHEYTAKLAKHKNIDFQKYGNGLTYLSEI